MSETFDTIEAMEEKKLPSGLNTLTILTIIGCAVGLIFSVWGFTNAEKRVTDMEKAMASPDFDKMPDFAKKMMTPEALEVTRTAATNKVPILIISLVGVTLCFVAALQMRKQKMQGYYLYLLGEIFPVICIPIFMGMAAYKGFGIIGLIIPVLFVILYTVQRKHLTK